MTVNVLIRLEKTVCFGEWGHERERMKDSVENDLVLREYDKSVFLI